MPFKVVTVHSTDAPWLTSKILDLIKKKKRNRLHLQAKPSNLQEDWNHFRQFRNLVTSKKRDRKMSSCGS